MFTYLVTSYRAPEQVYRLVARLRALSPQARIIVSHDVKSEPLSDDAIEGHGAVWYPTSEPVYWGDASYLRTTLSALETAQTGYEDDWYTLLTAQDYPLRALADYEDHLVRSGADALIEGPGSGDYYEFLLDRYRARTVRLPQWLGQPRALRVTTKVVHRLPGLTLHPQPHGLAPCLDVRRLRTPFGPDFVLYKGNDLYALNGRALRELLDARGRVLRYFEKTRIPSESFPHTVLYNSKQVRVRPEALHFVHWEGNHPVWITPALLEKALKTEFWFARKFTPSSPLLDLLDELLDPCA